MSNENKKSDFLAYQKSITNELEVIKNRVRYLIADHHWLSDGEHKEAVLRKTLRSHVARTLNIGKGFVCSPKGEVSTQIDILITRKDKPILFQDGELFIVTPDAVACIIEVKTTTDTTELSDYLKKLSSNVAMIRKNGNKHCFAGLFIYENESNNDEYWISNNREGEPRDQMALRFIQQQLFSGNSSQKDVDYVIDWVSLGSRLFIRHWDYLYQQDSFTYRNISEENSCWRSYDLPELGQAYFISNVVWDTYLKNVTPDDRSKPDQRMQSVWFSLPEGKESKKLSTIDLNGVIS